MKSPIKSMIVLLAAACGLAGGCWSGHPQSAYRLIHQYAINGDTNGVTTELAKSPDDLNLPEDGGLTPLHLAAENCHSNVVALLLAKGAKINIRASDDETPLHLAAQQGCVDVVTMLLAKGADREVRDKEGRTPLVRAQQWHQTNVFNLLDGSSSGK